ncbi:hypothetical protein AB4Y96_16260 [Phyllobacterium sp. TAF24]|uniref:hypothetical protein n=1 Tax=Phyllobacterium sp. TAF24 TaxID=3233068 RepID=UPI003F9D7B32
MISDTYGYDVRLALVQSLYEALAAGIPAATYQIFADHFEAEIQPLDSSTRWNGWFAGPGEFIEQSLTPFCHSLDRTSISCQAHVSGRDLVHVLVRARLLESGRWIACHQQWTVEGNKLAHLQSL